MTPELISSTLRPSAVSTTSTEAKRTLSPSKTRRAISPTSLRVSLSLTGSALAPCPRLCLQFRRIRSPAPGILFKSFAGGNSSGRIRSPALIFSSRSSFTVLFPFPVRDGRFFVYRSLTSPSKMTARYSFSISSKGEAAR